MKPNTVNPKPVRLHRLVPLAAILLSAALLLMMRLSLLGATEANARRENLRMLQTLLPGSASFTAQSVSGEDEAIRAAYRGENGFVVETCTRGYAGDIVLLVGVSDAGRTTGLVVRNLHETRGLGRAALRDHAFLAQFLNTSGDAAVGVNVDAITGATVTSRAVARGVNAAVAFVTGADAATHATE